MPADAAALEALADRVARLESRLAAVGSAEEILRRAMNRTTGETAPRRASKPGGAVVIPLRRNP